MGGLERVPGLGMDGRCGLHKRFYSVAGLYAAGEARIDIIVTAPPTSKTRRNAALHDQDVSEKKSVPLTRYVLGIMQFKDWFCFSVCPSTAIAEGGHSEGAKVDAVRRCPYPPER